MVERLYTQSSSEPLSSGNASLRALRSPERIMQLSRLGSLHQSPLSFMRSLVRTMMRDQWHIERAIDRLDERGFGWVLYHITISEAVYSFIVISDEISDAARNDRVIAEQWDATMALCMGALTEDDVLLLKDAIRRQEAGRMNACVLILSRGNKSSRMFDYVVECLSRGEQPSLQRFMEVGYLYRTTAVYGGGKFGMADWQKIQKHCPEFARPFAAEMFVCFMLRHFSSEQAERLARYRNPKKAVPIDDDIKRYIGIGNSTGLGMAPFLIRHPKLISHWVWVRELAIERACAQPNVSQKRCVEVQHIVAKARLHLMQSVVEDEAQSQKNSIMINELDQVSEVLQQYWQANTDWMALVQTSAQQWSIETQEILMSILMEVEFDAIQDLEETMAVDESYELDPTMSLTDLVALLRSHYAWALAFDYSSPETDYHFWYRSQEKMEPRLGRVGHDDGLDKALLLVIARDVQACLSRLESLTQSQPMSLTVGDFLLTEPEYRQLIARVQTMAQSPMGEIRVNMADEHLRPMDLLRCKLSFFGVGKFDPKSAVWVRNTMFQGAPVVSDIGQPFVDDWYFPVVAA